MILLTIKQNRPLLLMSSSNGYVFPLVYLTGKLENHPAVNHTSLTVLLEIPTPSPGADIDCQQSLPSELLIEYLQHLSQT